MEISDVRVKLMDNATDRLKAVCSVTFDEEFVVRDLKVVDGTNGLFVAMPSRKLAVHCPQCRHKNHLRARFCNDCGAKLPPNRVSADANGRVRLHRDIAHPINPAFRELVQTKVIERYTAERELAGQPGYQPADLDAELDEIADTSGAHDPHDAPVAISEITEYDALIASLKSGPGDAPPPRAPKPAPRESNPAPRESRPAPAPRRQEARGPAPAPTPVAEGRWSMLDEEPDDASPAPSAREVVSKEPPLTPKPAPQRPAPPKPAPAAPSRPAPPPAQSVGDEDAPFGAGIL